MAAPAAIAGSSAWMAPSWEWSLAASIAVAFLLCELRRHLPQNVRPGESTVLPTLGGGTTLTLLRGLFIALLAGFLAVPPPEGWHVWAPGFLYLGVAVADFFDGYVARVRNHATRLGEELDVRFDALGALVAIAALVHFGRLPAGFLPIGLLYYLFHGHMWLRARLGQPIVALRPNPYRRMYAGFLFGYLAVVLFPLFEPPWTVVAGCLFAAPVLAGFVVDWLFTTGAISPGNRLWRRLEPAALRLLYRALPLGLRMALLPISGLWLAETLSFGDLPGTALAIAALAAIGMTTAGWLGRLGALTLIAIASADAILRGPATTVDYSLLGMSIGVLLLGTGDGALWRPEDALLLRKAGSRDLPSRTEQAAA